MHTQYRNRLDRARKILAELEIQLIEVQSFLDVEPAHTSKIRELKNIKLDMTITNNEIEELEEKLKSF